jgi:hypothetical protein
VASTGETLEATHRRWRTQLSSKPRCSPPALLSAKPPGARGCRAD